MSTAAPPSALDATLELAAQFIGESDALLITAGAGMGVDSGFPDFRGNQGFWKAYPFMERFGMGFQDAASPQTFDTHPELAWGFYGHRLKLYRDTSPHAGFELLHRWGEAKTNGWAVFTSNVDGHFQKAGFRYGPLVECHGSLHHLQCSKPCSDDIWSADSLTPSVDESSGLLMNEMPICPHCGALARPNVLLFSDWQWVEHRTNLQLKSLHLWMESVRHGTVIELGAGSAIATVRNLGNKLNNRGWKLVRVNPETPLHAGPNKAFLPMGALDFTQAIQHRLQIS